MTYSIKVSGTLKVARMAMEFSTGLMVAFMRATGKITKQMVEDAWLLVMAGFTMVNGKTTWPMEKVSTTIFMVITTATKVNGLKTIRMGMDKKFGLMILPMKDSTKTETSMVWVALIGQMEILSKVNLLKTILQEKVLTNGKVVVSIVVHGKTIRWTARGCLVGMMAEDMKEPSSMTRKKATAFTSGLTTARNTKVFGRTVYNTEKEHLQAKKGQSKRVFGLTGKNSNGKALLNF